MATEKPFATQTLTYPAVNWRRFLATVFGEGVFAGLAVSQRAAGANFTIDVSAGSAMIAGDNTANQGAYFAQTLAVESVVVGAAPGSNSRIDRVIVRVNDPSAGGGAGNNCTIEVLAGVVSATPVAPAIPATAISLATILVAAGTPSITNGLITDTRAFATLANDVIDDDQATRLGTDAATASTVMRRDSAGRVYVATPVAAGQAANKAFVDAAVAVAQGTLDGGNIRYSRSAGIVHVWTTTLSSGGTSLPPGFRPATQVAVTFQTGSVSTNGNISTAGVISTGGTFNVSFAAAP